ncbi:MAG: HEAT repeat domain-containing protein [Spirochaetales bacterium]|nr:HEAT repeat domain-containing protein [Spirochaetales bacterium]
MKARALVFFGVILGGTAFAQSTQPAANTAQPTGNTSQPASAGTAGSQKTIEDVYLQSGVEVQVIKSLAAEESRADKVKALNYIAQMVDAKKVNANSKEVIHLLGSLGSEGVTKVIRSNGRIINDFPDVRMRAADLLGIIGGKQAQDILVNIALTDPEPMVVSSAVYSLGEIGGGSDHTRIEGIIAELVKEQDAILPDNNFAFAAVEALEMLGKKHEGKVNQEVFPALIRIANGNYIRPVREKAKEVLDMYTKL